MFEVIFVVDWFSIWIVCKDGVFVYGYCCGIVEVVDVDCDVVVLVDGVEVEVYFGLVFCIVDMVWVIYDVVVEVGCCRR